MLRLAVLLLLLANAGYYAWSHGLLQGLGLAPAATTEPQRLQQQIDPQNLRLLPPGGQPAPAAEPQPESSNSASAAEPPACLQAGVFDARQAELLRKAATRLPAGSWSLEPVQATRRWMVYMGPFADEDTLAKRRNELRAIGVAYDRPGSSAEGALRALSQLGAQGVRKARVVQERGDTAGFTLRLPAVDEALRAQLETLQPALAGKPLRSCA